MPKRAMRKRDRRPARWGVGQRRGNWQGVLMTGAALLLGVAIFLALAAPSRLGGGDSGESAVAEGPLPEGTARAGSVVVAEPVADLGHVPLNVTVQHVFRLVNDGSELVQLGRPGVVVLDGC
jgi:hypothetical protein